MCVPEIAAWEAELGNAYPLIVGGERFGAAKMLLTNVVTTDILLSSAGGFLQAIVSITLEEYAEGKTSQLLHATTTTNSAMEAAKKAGTVSHSQRG